MKTVRLAGAALLAGVSLAAPANAGTMAELCRSAVCVYDAENHIVSTADALRQIGGKDWYDVGTIGPFELLSPLVLYFRTADCTGDAWMMAPTILPQRAEYDGTSFWAPAKGDPVHFNWRSFLQNGQACNFFAPNCPNGACQANGGLATIIETVHFVAPFKVRYSPNLTAPPSLR